MVGAEGKDVAQTDRCHGDRGDPGLSRQPSLLSHKTLPERQPAGPFEKRSFANPSKV